MLKTMLRVTAKLLLPLFLLYLCKLTCCKHDAILFNGGISMQYRVQLRQLVDYPRCRVYRDFFRNLQKDREIGCSHQEKRSNLKSNGKVKEE